MSSSVTAPSAVKTLACHTNVTRCGSAGERFTAFARVLFGSKLRIAFDVSGFRLQISLARANLVSEGAGSRPRTYVAAASLARLTHS